MTYDSELIRAHNDFIEQINQIRETREANLLPKLSWTQLTLLFTKHNSWRIIKRDLEIYDDE